MPTTILRLPSVDEINLADDQLAAAKSALDDFTSRAQAFVGLVETIPEGVTLEDFIADQAATEREVDVEALARLLVFADELLEDADDIRAYAIALRQHLLTSYRSYVLEPRRHGEGT